MMTKEIQLTRGKVAIVDDDLFDEINQYRWQASERGRTWYAKRGAVIIYMHRQIMNAPHGTEVDHINGDGLDNRIENLRLCTRLQNSRNRKMKLNNPTGYKGVIKNTDEFKYRARIAVAGKYIWIGKFDTPEEAARAYDKVAIELYGEYARTNFND